MFARQVELVIRREGHPERRMVLQPGAVVVGRAEDNDIVLSDIGVSRRHARISVEGEGVFVEDMGSGNGTFFHGKAVERQLMSDGDEVSIEPFFLGFYVAGGDTTAEVTSGEATVVMGGPPVLANPRLELLTAHKMAQPSIELPPGRSFSIGRSEKADIALPEPAASRLHADVGETAGSWWVRDRGSSNGTWVNGVRVREKVLVDGDRLRIGTVEMAFVAPAAPAIEETSDRTEAFDAVMFTAAFIEPPAPVGHPPPPPENGFAPKAPLPSAGAPKPRPPAAPAPQAPLANVAAPTAPAPKSAAPHGAPPSSPQPGNVPPPPALPFAPRTMPRPAPTRLPTAPPPAAATSAAPGVELEFDVAKVKARKGPKGRAVRRNTGFLSRPINRISIGILLVAGMMAGARMVFDLGSSLLAQIQTSAAPAAPPAASSAPISPPDTPLAATTATPASAATPAPSSPAAVALPAPSARLELDPVRREEVAALMAEGMRLFTEGKQFEAAAQFYKVQQLDPGNPDAERMGYVACEFIAMQELHAALKVRSSTAAEGNAARTAALAAVDAAMTDSSRFSEARALLDTARALFPDDPDLAAADEKLGGRQNQVARGAAARRAEAKRANLAEMVADGQRELDRGNLAKAVQKWGDVLESDPTRASPQYYQAEEGIRSAKDKMKADSKKSYAAGLSAYKDGDYLTARNQLSQTVRIDPYNDGASSRLADVRKRLKEQASEIYKEARVLDDINQVTKALSLYQKVLTYVDDPRDPLSTKAQARINALMQ